MAKKMITTINPEQLALGYPTYELSCIWILIIVSPNPNKSSWSPWLLYFIIFLGVNIYNF